MMFCDGLIVHDLSIVLEEKFENGGMIIVSGLCCGKDPVFLYCLLLLSFWLMLVIDNLHFEYIIDDFIFLSFF